MVFEESYGYVVELKGVRRILEINSASFWVCEGIEEKKRVMEELKLRCECLRRNAIIELLRQIFE